MPVLIAHSHSARLAAGDALIAATATVNTRPIAARLTAFTRAHAALRKATDALSAAESKLIAAQQKVAEADADQDLAVDALANALVTLGQPRTRPFEGLSKLAPSRVRQLGYDAEAKALTAIVAKVRKRKGLTPAVNTACREAARSAQAVLDALDPVAAIAAQVDDARTKRDALTQPWETALATLKRVTRVAEDDGAKGLFDALFRATAAPKKPRAKKATTPAPTPTP